MLSVPRPTAPHKFGAQLHALVLGLAAAAAMAAAPAAWARSTPDADSSTVSLTELPGEARQTESLIRRGGPFPHAKDGAVFGNRERLLPRQHRGFYREYTVKTPGSRDRGARRIVCGGQEPKTPDACYYTADHYASFRRIAP